MFMCRVWSLSPLVPVVGTPFVPTEGCVPRDLILGMLLLSHSFLSPRIFQPEQISACSIPFSDNTHHSSVSVGAAFKNAEI